MATKFESLTKAEQRVVIAKDLIARLRAKTFTAYSGTYFSARFTRKELAGESAQVRTVLKTKKCKGCQLGGLFLCAVDRYDKLEMKDVPDISDMADIDMNPYLSRWFSAETLREVEKAFEGWGVYSEWRERHDADAERMRLIAQNIINNKGTFVPTKLLAA